jgi:hypothetical protein
MKVEMVKNAVLPLNCCLLQIEHVRTCSCPSVFYPLVLPVPTKMTGNCPTTKMIADYFTKPLQGSLFVKFRDLVMGTTHFSILDAPEPIVLGSVLENTSSPLSNMDMLVGCPNRGKYRNVKHVFIFYLFLWYIHICKYICSRCVFPYSPWIPIIGIG